LELIDQLNCSVLSGLFPDLTIFLDLPVEVGLTRKGEEGADNFDSAPRQFHERVREGYLAQVAREPEQWLVLDATRTPKDLAQEIWAKVQPLL
jgi:dTMP kinase